MDRNGIWNGQEQEWDIVNKYKADGKWHSSSYDADSWYVSDYKGSQFEQWNIYCTEPDGSRPYTWVTNSRTFNWKDGERTVSLEYERIQYGAYGRVYFFDNAFKAVKSGLAFWQMVVTMPATVNWWVNSVSYVDTKNTYQYNYNDSGYDNTFKFKMMSTSPALIAFWYPVSEKESMFDTRDDDNLYRCDYVATAWEWLPTFAVGSQIVRPDVFMPLAGNFFVTKNETYGLGIRTFYCWTGTDAPYLIDYTDKIWDKGANGQFHFGPKTNEYSAMKPSLSIY